MNIFLPSSFICAAISTIGAVASNELTLHPTRLKKRHRQRHASSGAAGQTSFNNKQASKQRIVSIVINYIF